MWVGVERGELTRQGRQYFIEVEGVGKELKGLNKRRWCSCRAWTQRAREMWISVGVSISVCEMERAVRSVGRVIGRRL